MQLTIHFKCNRQLFHNMSLCWLSFSNLLVDSVRKALHRYLGGHGFKSRAGLNFSGITFTTAQVVFVSMKTAVVFLKGCLFDNHFGDFQMSKPKMNQIDLRCVNFTDIQKAKLDIPEYYNRRNRCQKNILQRGNHIVPLLSFTHIQYFIPQRGNCVVLLLNFYSYPLCYDIERQQCCSVTQFYSYSL